MNVVVNGIDLEIRDATPSDVPLLMSLIRSLAEFEKLPVESTEDSLRDALFGQPPAAHALLAFVDGEPVGYATYFFTFASMRAKRGLWLDDLFVVPDFRGKGIGKAIMAYVAGIALQSRCGKMDWIVLDWNENAISFYRQLGALVLPDWKACRLDETQLARVVGQSIDQ